MPGPLRGARGVMLSVGGALLLVLGLLLVARDEPARVPDRTRPRAGAVRQPGAEDVTLAPGSEQRSQVPVEGAAGAGVPDRELVVHLRDESGRSVAAVEGPLVLAQPSFRLESPYRDGAARFAGLVPGVYRIEYPSSDVTLLEDTPVELTVDAATTEITCTVRATWSLVVVVEGRDGPPSPTTLVAAGYAPLPGSPTLRWITRKIEAHLGASSATLTLQVLQPVSEIELCVSNGGLLFHRETVRRPTTRVVVPWPGMARSELTGEITYRVRAAEGAVPAGTFPVLEPLFERGRARVQRPSGDVGGRFDRVPPHVEYRLAVRAEGFAPAQRTFVLADREVRDLGELVLRRPATLRGQVRGLPDELSRRRVSLFPLDRTDAEEVAHTDDDGRFGRSDLEPGPYAVCVTALSASERSSRVATVDLIPGGEVDVVLRLEPSAPLRLRAPLAPDFTSRVEVRDGAGLPVGGGFCPSVGEWLRCLPIGRYTVRVAAWEIAYETEVTLREGGVSLAFPP